MCAIIDYLWCNARCNASDAIQQYLLKSAVLSNIYVLRHLWTFSEGRRIKGWLRMKVGYMREYVLRLAQGMESSMDL